VLIDISETDAAWRRRLDRAGPRAGLPSTGDPDLHLVVDGRRIDVALRRDSVHVFRLAAAPVAVRIISRTGVPQEMGLARDPRSLGVGLRQIMVTRGARVRLIEAKDAMLIDGYYEFEAENEIRWTNEDAMVPASAFNGFSGPLEITLRLDGKTIYVDDGVVERVA
jgi:hypothetical protein